MHVLGSQIIPFNCKDENEMWLLFFDSQIDYMQHNIDLLCILYSRDMLLVVTVTKLSCLKIHEPNKHVVAIGVRTQPLHVGHNMKMVGHICFNSILFACHI